MNQYTYFLNSFLCGGQCFVQTSPYKETYPLKDLDRYITELGSVQINLYGREIEEKQITGKLASNRGENTFNSEDIMLLKNEV
jgi:hypothetical protein